jgi:Lar family restriction alleviation protein
MSKTDLKPCPFCGETTLVDRFRAGQGEGGKLAHIVMCRRCGAKTDYHDTMEKATRAWNRRTT